MGKFCSNESSFKAGVGGWGGKLTRFLQIPSMKQCRLSRIYIIRLQNDSRNGLGGRLIQRAHAVAGQTEMGFPIGHLHVPGQCGLVTLITSRTNFESWLH